MLNGPWHTLGGCRRNASLATAQVADATKLFGGQSSS
jgi:hypothetical protein